MTPSSSFSAGFLIRTAVLTAFLLTTGAPAAAARQAKTPQEDLFAAEPPLDLTLIGDLRPVFKDRSDDRPYRPARLRHRAENGDTVSFDLGVKTRGFYRRKYLNCDVPPLRLNFKKKQTPGTVFDGQDKLKLVTHCRNNAEAYERYALQEYLLYKTYNLLTDHSFRVRLVRITYLDTRRDRDPMTRFGFLIEDEDRLAERLGGRILPGGVINQEQTDQEGATLMAVFQYMIGNTDWTVPTHHNIKLLYLGPDEPPRSVPYDFDMAGIINTPYALPDRRLGIRTVRDRLFRGYCRTEEEFEGIFARFNEQREPLYDLYRAFPYLEDKYRDRSLDYLDDFYETINSSRSVKRDFFAACLKG